ncbi:MAG: hypothetical protein LBR17_02330 [Bacteroidales bacterium]|jgi:hypothetical protein|nr:hypothetical protein [Bacteroidales bacterium]
MKLYRVITAAISALMICNAGVTAQEKEKTYNETVIVTSNFNPIVSEAKKIDHNATTMDTELKKESVTLTPVELPFQPVMPLDTIKPAKVKGEPIEPLFNTHIAGGLGTYLTPYLDIAHSQTRSRDFIYSLHARHYSSLWSGMKEVAHSTFAENDIDIYAKKVWKNCYLDGFFYYSYDRNYWYGFNEDTINFDIKNKDYRASYNHVGFRTNYGSLSKHEYAIHNKASFDINHTSSLYGISETDISLLFSAYRHFHFWKGDPQTLGLKLKYQHFLYGNKFGTTPYFTEYSPVPYPVPDTLYVNTDYGKFNINPYFDFSIPQVKDLLFHIGFKVVPYVGWTESKVYFLPVIWAYYPVIKDLLHLKAGIDGDIHQRTLNETRIENPYISPSVQLLPEKDVRIFVQAFSNPLPALAMQLDLSVNFFSHKAFYTLDEMALLNNMFTLVYDNGKQYYAKFQLQYTITKTLNLMLNMQVQGFDVDSIATAWYQPVLNVNMTVEYLVGKKLRVQFTPSFFTSVKAINEMGETISLNPRIDLNIAAQYDYNKQLSFFIKLNNLACQRQYQYIHYPSQRFMGMIGAKVAF